VGKTDLHLSTCFLDLIYCISNTRWSAILLQVVCQIIYEQSTKWVFVLWINNSWRFLIPSNVSAPLYSYYSMLFWVVKVLVSYLLLLFLGPWTNSEWLRIHTDLWIPDFLFIDSVYLPAKFNHLTIKLLGIDHVGHYGRPTPSHLEMFPTWQSRRLTGHYETIRRNNIRFDCSSPAPSWSFPPEQYWLLRHATWILRFIGLSPVLRIPNRTLSYLSLPITSSNMFSPFPSLWRIIPVHQYHRLWRTSCIVNNFPLSFHTRNELHILLRRRLPLSDVDDDVTSSSAFHFSLSPFFSNAKTGKLLQN